VKVTAPAQITKVQTMADGSIQTVASHPELPPKEMATLFELRKSQGWWLFSENPLTEQDVPEEKAQVGEKTQAQRLRAVLHVLWEQRGRQGTSETFYRTNMENIINQVKEQLDD